MANNYKEEDNKNKNFNNRNTGNVNTGSDMNQDTDIVGGESDTQDIKKDKDNQNR